MRRKTGPDHSSFQTSLQRLLAAPFWPSQSKCGQSCSARQPTQHSRRAPAAPAARRGSPPSCRALVPRPPGAARAFGATAPGVAVAGRLCHARAAGGDGCAYHWLTSLFLSGCLIPIVCCGSVVSGFPTRYQRESQHPRVAAACAFAELVFEVLAARNPHTIADPQSRDVHEIRERGAPRWRFPWRRGLHAIPAGALWPIQDPVELRARLAQSPEHRASFRCA